jgi:hypothetical protein
MKPTWTDNEALRVYKRVTGDNPWNSDRNVFDRKTMARSIGKVVDAKTIKEAIEEILGWWGFGKEETTVRQIRKAYKEWRKLHRKVTPVIQLSLVSAYAKYRKDRPGVFNWRTRHLANQLKDAFESGWKAAMKRRLG